MKVLTRNYSRLDGDAVRVPVQSICPDQDCLTWADPLNPVRPRVRTRSSKIRAVKEGG
jgi:hypothetical protein